MDTVESRRRIGFPTTKEQWGEAPAIYDAHSLRIAGHPVMEDWEQNYMDTLGAIAASRGGTVLELGYGMGLSAMAIQSHHEVTNHIIVECHPDVVRKCLTDFKPAIDSGRMHVYSGFWQDVTPTLAPGMFDGILFDTYPLREEEIHGNHFWFFREAYRLLRPGGILTYYSDEIDHLSKPHLAKLTEAGFRKNDISYQVCQVSPPPDCEYWQAPTIVAPVVRKATLPKLPFMPRRHREAVKSRR